MPVQLNLAKETEQSCMECFLTVLSGYFIKVHKATFGKPQLSIKYVKYFMEVFTLKRYWYTTLIRFRKVVERH